MRQAATRGAPSRLFLLPLLLLGAATAPHPAWAADAAAAPAPETGGPSAAAAKWVAVAGAVINGEGKPVPDVAVFAVPSGGSRVSRIARSGRDGRFVLQLPPVVHDFGIMSARWHLTQFAMVGKGEVKMTVAAAFPDIDPAQIVRTGTRSALTNVLPMKPAGGGSEGGPTGLSVGMLTGTVTDEGGIGLAGVRVLAVDDKENALVSVGQSDQRGQYRLVTLARPTRLFVYAPGLVLEKVRRPAAGKVDLILSIDAIAEQLTLRTGRVLSFRIQDSKMPEAYPPKVVMATLLQDYGIDVRACFCPGDLITAPPPTLEERRNACRWSARERCSGAGRCPLTVWARQCSLPRYWWLRLLQTPPPNPAQRDAVFAGMEPSRTEGPNSTSSEARSLWWYDAIKAMQEADARAAGTRSSR